MLWFLTDTCSKTIGAPGTEGRGLAFFSTCSLHFGGRRSKPASRGGEGGDSWDILILGTFYLVVSS